MEALSRETLENMMEQAVAKATTVSFWPQGEAPGAKNSDAVFTPEPRHTGTSQYDRAVTGIRAPEITVYAPAKPNGIGILVTPGGSYRRVVMDKEGSVLAPFFNARGYTLFVMTYRMPGDGHEEGANAHEWKINPDRIGVLGFSSGGHVAASLGTRFAETVYMPIDNVDEQPARPAFMALVYPVVTLREDIGHPGSRLELVGAKPEKEDLRHYSLEERVDSTTPPTFLLHAIDDPAVKVENSLVFFNALREQGVPVEMHLFERGKHGFGIRDAQGLPLAIWPEMMMNWVATKV
ncbi:Xylanase [Citrobacter freundii]|uniref:alpha/beta hydrolase n=1 Tax=Citrobacter freundii TaxID=546 RepID=UPI003B24D6D3